MTSQPNTRPEADPERLKYFSFNVFTQLSGAVTAGMVHLGDRLGLYAVMADAAEPLTTIEIADRAGLDERWVREWISNQAAAKLVVVEPGTPDRFGLTAEGVAVLASPDHPGYGMGMFHRFPQTMAALEVMPESFRTGLGHDYDSHGAEGAVGIERSFEPWNRHHLLPTVLPALDGVVERLTAGATVADVGCGAGGAVIMMAEAFPNSRFIGYDISQHALERAGLRPQHLAFRGRPIENLLPGRAPCGRRGQPSSSPTGWVQTDSHLDDRCLRRRRSVQRGVCQRPLHRIRHSRSR